MGFKPMTKYFPGSEISKKKAYKILEERACGISKEKGYKILKEKAYNILALMGFKPMTSIAKYFSAYEISREP